jgi:hypothetical protein
VPAYFTYKAPFAQLVTTPGTTVTLGKLPPNAKLLSYALECSVALVTATNVGVTLGKGGGTGSEFSASANSGATVARTAPTLVAGVDSGASGCDLTATFIAAGGNATAGEVTVIVGYIVS